MAFAAATTTREHEQEQQQNLNPDQRQQHQQQRPAATTTAAAPAMRPLSAYNRSNAAAAVGDAAAPVAARAPPPPFDPAPSISSSTFPLPSSVKVALEELRVSLDPRLVTHPTGHVMLPALAAAGIRAQVGGSGEGKQTHSLQRWRTVLFFRRRMKGLSASRGRRAAPQRHGDGFYDDDDGDGDGDGEEEEGDDSFEEEQVPFVLACLTAADVVRAVDRARSEKAVEQQQQGHFNTDFDPGAGLERLVREAARHHPGCSLGVVVEGLESHCISRERADAAARGLRGPSSSLASPPRRGRGGGAGGDSDNIDGFVARRYDPRLLAASAALRHPALRLALLPDAAAAAEHLVGLARARGAAAAGFRRRCWRRLFFFFVISAAAAAAAAAAADARRREEGRHAGGEGGAAAARVGGSVAAGAAAPRVGRGARPRAGSDPGCGPRRGDRRVGGARELWRADALRRGGGRGRKRRSESGGGGDRRAEDQDTRRRRRRRERRPGIGTKGGPRGGEEDRGDGEGRGRRGCGGLVNGEVGGGQLFESNKRRRRRKIARQNKIEMVIASRLVPRTAASTARSAEWISVPEGLRTLSWY